jgi:hypothetical protein
VSVALGGDNLGRVDPSKPTDPKVDPSTSIPRSRPRSDEVLEGEVIPKGAPIGPRTMPSEPVGPAPGLYDTPVSAARRAEEAKPRRKGRVRRVFVVVAALAVAFCLAGVGVAYILYDKATTPDRSSPSVTLQQYLDEKFENRNEQKAAALVCQSPKLDAVDAMLTDLKSREAKAGVTIDVKSSDVVVTQTGSNAGIDANLKISTTVNGVEQRDIEKWHFDLVKESGWRVCAAAQVQGG